MSRTGWKGARRNPLTLLALVGLAVLVACAIVAPQVWGHAAAITSMREAMRGPSADHLLGTDSLGRDVLARVLVAARSSLSLAVLATLTGGVLGILLGALSAALGTRLSRLVSALIGILVAFPPLLLAIFFAVVFGLGARGVVLAVGAAFMPGFARLTETLAASVSRRDYVDAARLLGVGRTKLVLRHILPNVAEPIVLYTTVHIGVALLALSGLSFLGFGVQPPGYDWGSLLAEGLPRIYTTPVGTLAPGAAIVLAGLGFNLAGEAAAGLAGRRASSQRAATTRPPVPTGAHGPSTQATEGDVVLHVHGLTVRMPGPTGPADAVRQVSLTVREGEIVGIVGESGSGKSLTALAVAQLLGDTAQIQVARHEFLGHDLTRPANADTRRVLGTSLALVYQDPGSTLNPALRVGGQLTEGARIHLGLDRRDAFARALAAFDAVAMPAARHRLRQYQHEFSGGMKQRAVIAMGLMTSPKLLIADEPTTALDVTVQAQILRLLCRMRDDHGTAVLLISHDIAVVSQVCDRVLVMYAGHIVEEGSTSVLLRQSAHPYTRALLHSTLDMTTDLRRPLPTVPGRVPSPADTTAGCRFADRCGLADDRCHSVLPALTDITDGHRAACWHPQPPTAGVATTTSSREADGV